jgi:hypothetical protein
VEAVEVILEQVTLEAEVELEDLDNFLLKLYPQEQLQLLSEAEELYLQQALQQNLMQEDHHQFQLQVEEEVYNHHQEHQEQLLLKEDQVEEAELIIQLT